MRFPPGGGWSDQTPGDRGIQEQVLRDDQEPGPVRPCFPDSSSRCSGRTPTSRQSGHNPVGSGIVPSLLLQGDTAPRPFDACPPNLATVAGRSPPETTVSLEPISPKRRTHSKVRRNQNDSLSPGPS